MPRTPRRSQRVALTAATLASAALLAACGSGGGSPSAAPTGATTATGESGGGPSQTSAPSDAATPGTAVSSPAAVSSGTAGGGSGTARCHTSDLSASLGGDDPGAGQENFSVVLTNTSGRSCTVAGYPGAAFTDGAGRQLGPDPSRAAGTPKVIVLAPGRSAWSALSFGNPQVSGARAAKPSWLLVTPPDERESLRLRWAGGDVPIAGAAATPSLTVLSPGSGS